MATSESQSYSGLVLELAEEFLDRFGGSRRGGARVGFSGIVYLGFTPPGFMMPRLARLDFPAKPPSFRFSFAFSGPAFIIKHPPPPLAWRL
jgi:hypothetical protein